MNGEVIRQSDVVLDTKASSGARDTIGCSSPIACSNSKFGRRNDGRSVNKRDTLRVFSVQDVDAEEESDGKC